MLKYPVNCALDLETLGKGDHAQIVQIGMVAFSPLESIDGMEAGMIGAPGHELRAFIDLNDPLAGKADADTAVWWMQQEGGFGCCCWHCVRRQLAEFGWLLGAPANGVERCCCLVGFHSRGSEVWAGLD